MNSNLLLNKNTIKGFSLVEVVLSVSLLAMMAVTFLGITNGQSVVSSVGNWTRASWLSEEGLEAARSVRDGSGFNAITSGTFGVSTTSNKWAFSGTQDVSSIYTRKITFAKDWQRLFATSTITWQQDMSRNGNVALAGELTNWAASMGNWSTIHQGSVYGAAGNANGIKIQLQGIYAYMVRNGTPDFVVTNVSNPSAISLVGAINSADSLTGVAVSGNYAYASDTNTAHELEVINITNPAAPAVVGNYNSTLNNGTNAMNVFVVGTKAYLVGLYLEIIDVTNPAAPVSLGSYNLGATGSDVYVLGNYAYVTTATAARALEIINISNPASPTLAGTLTGTAGATTVVAFDNYAVMGQGTALLTVNVSNPASPTRLGTLTMPGTIADISLGLGNSYLFVSTSVNNGALTTVDDSNLISPFIVGTFNAGTAWNGAAYSTTTNAVFGATPLNNSEVMSALPI